MNEEKYRIDKEPPALERSYVQKARNKYRRATDLSPELIQGVRTGNAEAYNEFYMHFVDPLMDFVLTLIHNQEDAEEIVQDTFTYLWEKREILDSQRSVKGLLFTCAQNYCFDYFRRKKVADKYLSMQLHVSDNELPADEYLIAKQTDLFIEMTVATMPDQRRRVFEMNHNENQTVGEIALTLGISERAVRKHLAAAREDLDKILMCICLFTLMQ